MPTVLAVSLRRGHHFSKTPSLSIRLLAGLGVEGDGHLGATVQHRSRKRWNPQLPNLRQVHLIHAELLDALAAEGFAVAPGQLGENITTRALDLLRLPRGTRLAMGGAVLEVTGLRNPCRQIEAFRPGLLARLARKRGDGAIERLAGIMAVALSGGEVRAGDAIRVDLPAGPHWPLEPV